MSNFAPAAFSTNKKQEIIEFHVEYGIGVYSINLVLNYTYDGQLKDWEITTNGGQDSFSFGGQNPDNLIALECVSELLCKVHTYLKDNFFKDVS